MTSYPKYQPDAKGRVPGEVGGAAYGFVITLGYAHPLPLIRHTSNGHAAFMCYRREREAIKARERVRAETTWGSEVRVFDKSKGWLI